MVIQLLQLQVWNEVVLYFSLIIFAVHQAKKWIIRCKKKKKIDYFSGLKKKKSVMQHCLSYHKLFFFKWTLLFHELLVNMDFMSKKPKPWRGWTTFRDFPLVLESVLWSEDVYLKHVMLRTENILANMFSLPLIFLLLTLHSREQHWVV